MSVKSLIFYSVTCITIISIAQARRIVNNPKTRADSNPERQLACWPDPLKYEQFNIGIYFWSRNQRDQQILENSSFGSGGIDFDPKRRTVVIVHGLVANAHEDFLLSLVNNLLEWENVNIIVPSWEDGCSNILVYHQAAANTELTAITVKNLFGRLIDYSKSENIPLKNWGPVHIIGHSLGAHVAGQAAELIKQQHNLVVDRVTGLDPAEPCFEDADMPLRLNKTNAGFVDIIHTDAALERNHAYGLRDPIGHIDFYINGGSIQPGCEKSRKKRYLDYAALISHALNNGGCPHVRAFTLFDESVNQASKNKCKFWAHPWSLDSSPEDTASILQQKCNAKTCIEMGINADSYEDSNQSIYYVATTGAAPFCDV